jgi:hypothetical protein
MCVPAANVTQCSVATKLYPSGYTKNILILHWIENQDTSSLHVGNTGTLVYWKFLTSVNQKHAQ